MRKLRCSDPRCGTWLNVELPEGGYAFVSTFPDDLVRCLEQLTLGVAITLCPNGHKNLLPGPALCIDAGRSFGILYLPPDTADSADDIEAGLRHTTGTACRICRVADQRGFKRAFIEGYVGRHAATLNEFGQSDRPYQWVQQNPERVGYEFMAAGFLLTTGAFPVGKVPIDQATASDLAVAFRPHEEVEHLITEEGTRQVRAAMAKQLAAILFGHIVAIMLEMLEKRSAAEVPKRVSALVPPPLLLTDVAQNLADKVREYASRTPLGKPGATGVRYCVEAIHALIHHACETDNPRREDWTRMLVRYEFERRLDGTGEGLLLPPELVRATIDQDEFWTTVRGFAAYIDPKEPDHTAKADHLVDTAERIYPGAGHRLLDPGVIFAKDLADETLAEALTREALTKALVGAGDNGPGFVRTLLNGLIRDRPDLVEPVAERLHDAALDVGLGVEFAARCVSNIIEVLNKATRHKLAYRLALSAHERLTRDGLWPSELTRPTSRFLNELGNCHRYAGEFEAALACYDAVLAFLPENLEDFDRRVLEANRAIVYRSLGRLEEAKLVFQRLLANANDGERIGLIHSEALCWVLQGETDRAIELLKRHLPHLLGRSAFDFSIRGFQIILAVLLANSGNKAEAEPLFAAVAAAADRARDLPVAASARAMALICKNERGSRLLEQCEEELFKALDDAFQLGGAPSVAAAIAGLLSEALHEARRFTEAEKVVRRTLEWLESRESQDEWRLRLSAAELALARRDGRQAASDIAAAYQALSVKVVGMDLNQDAFSLLTQHERDLVRFASLVTDAAEGGLFGFGALRIAADIQNSLVLSSRLSLRESEPNNNPLEVYSDAGISNLLNGSTAPAGLVQSVELEDGLFLVVTSLEEGVPRTRVQPLGLERQTLAAVNRRLTFRLHTLDAAAASLELDTVTDWPDARDRLREAVAEIPAGAILCVVPGKIGSIPFTLALGERNPLAFVPSLVVAQRLRRRRLSMPGGASWRPAAIFDFAVWQQAEKPSSVAAIRSAAERLRKFADGRHLPYARSFGEQGTAQALMAGLTQADLLRLACHGRIDINALGAELLLAAEDLLPPSIVTIGRNGHGVNHLLSWRELAGLTDVSPIVLSGACSSGEALLRDGGERLGLERPLFMAGAVAFVAPQWPVSMEEIQRLNVAIAEAYISDPAKPLAIAIWDQVNGRSLSPLTRMAIGLFGDWL